tara:strand:+ start:1299 stop:1568 length:270 start_codon:yes stop_codon:yes gene_type:complete
VILDNEIYVIKGKNLKRIVSLLHDLKNVAIEYAKTNESDVEETTLFYDDFIRNILGSKMFKDLKLMDLQEEFSFQELLRNSGLKLNRRK